MALPSVLAVCLFVIIAITRASFGETQVQSGQYRRLGLNGERLSQPFKTVTTRSRLQCANFCQKESCVAFSHHAAEGNCELTDEKGWTLGYDQTGDSGWRMYKTDINECSTGIPCNTGVCTDTPGSFTCDCSGTGFEGDTCAIDISECSTDTPCNTGVCTNTPGSFTCNCSGTGFEGDTCASDINECSTSTPCNTGVCTNTPGSFTCNCSGTGFEGDTCSSAKHSCSSFPVGMSDGVYTIYPSGVDGEEVTVYCQFDAEGNWTVIQKRFDGSVDFYRNWEVYKNGFGNKDGEYWIGNKALHQLTSHGNYTLKVLLTDWDGTTKCARYSTFRIASEADKYRITVSGYSGDAGGSMDWNNGKQFSTRDDDNDNWSRNCAVSYMGAWWYNSCSSSSLNGVYHPSASPTDGTGIRWDHWHGWRYSLKTTTMMIKRTVE